MKTNIVQIIEGLSPISLQEMDGVSLMKRTDTKFVIHENQLLSVLEIIKNEYKVLQINDDRIMTYSSLYFDTNSTKFYNDHHNGKIKRTKIRIRKYVESNIFFLEVKQKDGKGKTNKSRVPLEGFEPSLSENSVKFIEKVTKTSFDLKPIIWNRFNRITLVNNTAKERLTIDLNLSFKNEANTKEYSKLVIIEVKQERFNRNSPIVTALRNHGVMPYSLSKYCIGMASLYKDLKYNNFKQKQLKINKITA
ncbi:polyphosphate polymerase domain-containing protein [Mariniflexile sp.]|uniref:polyphosphate polymerase domain-containing protein n=1 Tax=Mariniflexile sp. TaxID=1979402 RepID=UPI0035662136